MTDYIQGMCDSILYKFDYTHTHDSTANKTCLKETEKCNDIWTPAISNNWNETNIELAITTN